MVGCGSQRRSRWRLAAPSLCTISPMINKIVTSGWGRGHIRGQRSVHWGPECDLWKLRWGLMNRFHYCVVIMGAVASQITSVAIVHSIVYSDADKKKTSELRVTGLRVGTDELPAQMTSYAENVSIWRRHHVLRSYFSRIITNIDKSLHPL